MALFDEILAKAEEADRAVLDKYPALRQSLLELETIRPQYAAAARKVEEWNDWSQKHFDREHGTTKAELALRTQYAEAVEELERLRAARETGESEMTFAEIEAQLKGKFATKEDVNSALDSRRFATQESVQKGFNTLDNGMVAMYTRTATLPLKHYREFNEDLDMEQVFKYMSDHSVPDPQVAYDQMVASKREAVRVASDKARNEELEKIKAEHDAAMKLKDEEIAAARAASGSIPPMPVDNGVGISPIRIAKVLGGEDKGPQVPEGDDYSIGRGGLAAVAARAMREKGTLTPVS